MKRVTLGFAALVLAVTAVAQTAPASGAQGADPQAQPPAQQQNVPVVPPPSRTPARGEDAGQQSQRVPVAGEQPAQSPGEHALPAGTPIVAELTKVIDVKKAKEGDAVTARSLQDVLREGNVVIPRGARLVGHVTHAQRAGKGNDQSELAIAWDRVETRSGQQFPLHADIQALAPRMQMAENAATTTVGNRPQDEPMGAPTMGAPPMGNPGGGAAGTANPGGVGMPSGTQGSDMGGIAGPTDMPRSGQRGGTPPLNPHSTGVQAMRGVTLSPQGDATRGSMIRDERGNLKLENGTQLVLRVVAP